MFLKRDLFQVTLTKGIIFIQDEFIYILFVFLGNKYLVSLNLSPY